MSEKFKVLRLYCPRCNMHYVVTDSLRCRFCFNELVPYRKRNGEGS